jgi:hypothetical protein
MTAYELHWHPSSHVLALRLSYSLDASSAQQMNEDILRILGESQQPVNLVIDAQSLAVTTDFLNVREQLTYPSHPQIGRVSVIAANKLSRLWLLLIHKHCRKPVELFEPTDNAAQGLSAYLSGGA